MRLLLVNDDGIEAPGLALIEALMRERGHEIWVFAPLHQQSGKSRSITLHDEVRVHERGEQRFAIDGTPVDCVLFALTNIMANDLPDLVISGMNIGANLAEDVSYSGTCGAALEAASCGIPALAISQISGERGCDYELAKTLLEPRIDSFVAESTDSRRVLNVNLPNVAAEGGAEVHVVPLGQRPLGTPMLQVGENRGAQLYAYPGRYPQHPENMADDLDVVYSGHIAVTPLQSTYANAAALDQLRGVFDR